MLAAASVPLALVVTAVPPSGTPAASQALSQPGRRGRRRPAVTLRVLSGPGPAVAGDEVRYEVRVTAGPRARPAPLDVVLDTPGGATCDRRRLVAGGEAVCRGRDVVTADDVAAGSLVHTVTVGEVSDSASVPITATTGLALTVRARQPVDAGPGVDRLVQGEVVDLAYTVTNTGTATVSGLTVAPGLLLPGRVACVATTLRPGARTTCRAAYTARRTTSTERPPAAAGSLFDANAAARTADGGVVASRRARVAVPAARSLGLRVVAEVSTGAGPVVVGDTVGLRYRVRNTGDQSVRDLVLRTRAGSGLSCDRTALIARQYASCTATHLVTADDVAAGAVVDRARVVGRAADGTRTTARADAVAVPAVDDAGLEIARSVHGLPDAEDDGVALGDTVEHVFTVTNTSGMPVTRVDVADSLLPADAVACDNTSLAPGDATECRGTQEVTQEDLDTAVGADGRIVATANATAVAGGAIAGDTVASQQDTTEIPAEQQAALTLAASVVSGAGPVVAGDVVDYRLVVTNVGDLTVTGLRFDDDLLSGFRCDRNALGSGRTATCTASRLVADTDVDAGSLVDRATAYGTAVGGTPVITPTDQTSVATSAVTGLRLVTRVAGTAGTVRCRSTAPSTSSTR